MGLKYKHVYALDTEDTDLLSKLTECIEFVKEGRNADGVLVHWSVNQITEHWKHLTVNWLY